jgi:hypothetical protein
MQHAGGCAASAAVAAAVVAAVVAVASSPSPRIIDVRDTESFTEDAFPAASMC